MNNEAIFTKVLSSQKRKYYLDVKMAKNGSKYLVISEQVVGDTPDKNERHRIMIFDDAFNDFAAAMDEIKGQMK